MILGSCFATEMGQRMLRDGWDCCVNPFGTLFNPASIRNSIERLDSAEHFTAEDCIPMGAGAGKICSFYHHTYFARERQEDFLSVANEALDKACAFWRECDTVIITLGTAFVWRYRSSGEVVSNCLKRPGYEFSHEMLTLEQISGILRWMTDNHRAKRFIFTVSPIRHLGDGAHSNTLSKSTLQLAIARVAPQAYFPSYEILLDELRDYKWFAQDKVHPSPEAVDIIWKRFSDEVLSSAASDCR